MRTTRDDTPPPPSRAAGAATAHVVYRSTGGENHKDRPSYYSKRVCLLSFVQALEAAGQEVDVVFLNDGPIPDERLDIMHRYGEVVPFSGGSNRVSYRFALRLAAQRWSDPKDLVWFAEDDYLYTPHALQCLLTAAEQVPGADYFALYARLALDPRSPRRRSACRPADRSLDDPHAIGIDGLRWFRAMSTTSTFGVRGDVLAHDLRLLRALPLTGGAWDHATCLTVQGRQPYTWPQVGEDLLPVGQPLSLWPRAVFRGAARAAANLRSRRRPHLCRVLLAADPEPITHCEQAGLAPGTAWADVAARARDGEADLVRTS